MWKLKSFCTSMCETWCWSQNPQKWWNLGDYINQIWNWSRSKHQVLNWCNNYCFTGCPTRYLSICETGLPFVDDFPRAFQNDETELWDLARLQPNWFDLDAMCAQLKFEMKTSYINIASRMEIVAVNILFIIVDQCWFRYDMVGFILI